MLRTSKKLFREILIVLITVIACVTVGTLLFSSRTQYHIDEVWSYMLSNKTDGPFLYSHSLVGQERMDPNNKDTPVSELESVVAYFDHWHTASEYRDSVTVQKGEQFKYDTVIWNQECDIHPPLYYFILHTICSLFPDEFSWWFAYSINVVAYAIALIFIYLIARRLGTGLWGSLFAVVMYALSSVGLCTLGFLRMYMLVTMFAIICVYNVIRLFQTCKLYYLVFVCVFSVLAFLTQYVAYMYLCVLTVVFFIYSVLNKRVKLGLFLCVVELLSVGIAIAVFPRTLYHIFDSVYSDIALNGSNILFASVTRAFSLIVTDLPVPCVCFGVLWLVHICRYLCNKVKIKKRCISRNITDVVKIKRYIRLYKFLYWRRTWNYCKSDMIVALLIVSLVSSVIIKNRTPWYGIFTIRYLFISVVLLPVCLANMAHLVFGRMKRQARNLFMISGVSGILMTSLLLFSPLTLKFYYNIRGGNIDLSSYFDGNTVVVYNNNFHGQILAPYLTNVDKVYAAKEWNDCISVINEQKGLVYLLIDWDSGEGSSLVAGFDARDQSVFDGLSGIVELVADPYIESGETTRWYLYRVVN